LRSYFFGAVYDPPTGPCLVRYRGGQPLASAGDMTDIHSVNQVWSGDWLPLAMMHLLLLGVVIGWVIWDNWRAPKHKNKS